MNKGLKKDEKTENKWTKYDKIVVACLLASKLALGLKSGYKNR